MADKLVTFIIFFGFLALVAGLVYEGGNHYRSKTLTIQENLYDRP